MDLHALRIDLIHQSATVRAADADGVAEHELTGGDFLRIQEAAQPLLDWAHAHLDKALRTPADATLGHIELDAMERRVRLGFLAEQSVPVQPRSSRTPPALRECEVDYDAVQGLLREAARTAVRSIFTRQPEPSELGPDERWERKYQTRSDGWELGRVPPPLARGIEAVLRAKELVPATGGPVRAVVVGCGRGHEARLLARRGAAVTALDIAPSAVRYLTEAAAREGLRDRLTVLQADLFTLAATDPRHRGAYDLLTEHCVFCAIEPVRRDEYVQAAAALLRPGGLLLGLFYCHGYPGGPPYGATASEVRARLGAAFDILSEEVPPDSVITRAGQELLLTARRRPTA
jgi:SAM-dependent methyltransferase